jgi:hypothetical protein
VEQVGVEMGFKFDNVTQLWYDLTEAEVDYDEVLNQISFYWSRGNDTNIPAFMLNMKYKNIDTPDIEISYQAKDKIDMDFYSKHSSPYISIENINFDDSLVAIFTMMVGFCMAYFGIRLVIGTVFMGLI